jgi:hypothetical protein
LPSMTFAPVLPVPLTLPAGVIVEVAGVRR